MKRLLIISIMFLFFLLGYVTNYAFNDILIDKESPFFISFSDNNIQPGDWVAKEEIELYKDKIIINIEDASISSYANTGSMLPTFGEKANGIRIVPSSAGQIEIGDLVSYERENKLIIHRVIEKGNDGRYWFITKGDNNQESDGKIYFEEIKYVTIGVIY